MTPNELQADDFGGYPPEAKQLAASHIELLRKLPLGFLPLLLREVIVYDWKFPAERKEIDNQFHYLSSLSIEQMESRMSQFSGLRLSKELERSDWVNAPGPFSEQLSAHLWATHQIDSFRQAAVEYMQKVNQAAIVDAMPAPRLAIVLIGQGVQENKYPLFRKLRRYGVYYSRVRGENGRQMLLDAVARRAEQHPVPFAHWYIDGGKLEPLAAGRVTCVSYRALDEVKSALFRRIEKAMESGVGSEALRSSLASMRPEELGMDGRGADAIVNRFKISMLTEGAGTQLYSTTFVQWCAREALRRAQPLTLLARFTPRWRERPMQDLLSLNFDTAPVDAAGSLIDADMGAYYTWINQQRLPGAERAGFLVWFEDHNEALAIAPGLPRGKEDSASVGLDQLLQHLV